MNFGINPYGLLIAISAYLGLIISKSRAHIYHLKDTQIENAFFVCIITGLFGARAYHVVDKWNYYQNHLGEIILIWHGGLGIFGALLAGLFGLWLYSSLTGTGLGKLADCFAPSVALGQAIGRLGNYFNQEGFGPPTSLPCGVFIQASKRPEQFKNFEHFHPTFFYEAFLCMCLFLILINISMKLRSRPGALTGLYFIGYSTIRIFTESLRVDTAQIFQIKVAYLISGLFILIGIWCLGRSNRYSIDPQQERNY